mgnify:CR=1 FL=1
MTEADKNILKRRLIRLKALKPSTKKEQALVDKEIREAERELAGKKPMGRPRKKEKRPLMAKRIDWDKVAKAAAKL